MEFIKKIVIYILTWEAQMVLRRYHPRIIAITGSVGKTSGKDAIYTALSGQLHVRKSEKSLNSGVGVPLAILGCESGWKNPFRWIANIFLGLELIIFRSEYPEFLVLEVGADRPGDIGRIARWLKPDIAIITGIPDIPAHVEYFDSVADVVREKRALAEHLSSDGKLILNGDDENARGMRADFRGVASTYGMLGDNDFTASHDEIAYEDGMPIGMHFRVNYAGASVPVQISGGLGDSRVYAALAAIAVAHTLGLDLVAACEALAHHQPTPGRMRIVPGIKHTTIIDDTYNSSPIAALSALDTLKRIETNGRKIAILGDMLELGRFSTSAHRQVGERVVGSADMLITVGIRARAIAEAARDAGMSDDAILQYEQNESVRAGEELQNSLQAGDVILVKGSQLMRMERTVHELMAEPERANELLVRQNAEWLVKA